MNIRRVNQKDIEIINSWAVAWKLNAYPEGSLPEIGFIIEDVAAGFLYKTDSKVAYIEAVMSNPKANKKNRYDAVAEISNAIVDCAKELGFKYILGLSNNESVLKNAKENGYIISDEDFKLLVKVV